MNRSHIYLPASEDVLNVAQDLFVVWLIAGLVDSCTIAAGRDTLRTQTSLHRLEISLSSYPRASPAVSPPKPLLEMTKTSTLSWPSEPTKVILRWVEQNKGPQGPLRQQYDTILPDLLDQLLRLGNEFPGFDKQPEESRKSKTQAKLRSLWTTYQLPVYKKKKTATWNTAFFEEGLAALDQSQLGPDFRDLFASALQNGADDENAAASETSSHNQPTRKRRLDGDQEQTDGPNRSHSAKHQRLTAHVAGTEEIPTGDDLTAPENGAQGRTNSAFFSASQDQQARSKPLPNDAATKKVLSNDASTKKDLSEDAYVILYLKKCLLV